MSERRVTLADVARKAGVHVTTVSLALRNNRRLPEPTRQRLQALAKRMGYAPDPFLRALVAYRDRNSHRRNPPTLAYVTNWNSRWGWRRTTAHPDFYAGAASKAAELGFQLEHFWLREPGLTHGRLSHILYARGISGVIIASHVREFDLALQFDWSQFSAVKIDYFPHQPQLHNVTNNQLQIVRLAMRKVIGAGYRRIGMVMDEGYDITVDRLWSAGFLWEQQGLKPRERIPPLMGPGGFEAWYREHRPEVILSKAEFILPALEALRIKFPADVALVDLFLEQNDGKMAGVRQNHGTVGELAIEILVGQLQHNKFGVPQIPTTTYVEGTWFDGASCPLSH